MDVSSSFEEEGPPTIESSEIREEMEPSLVNKVGVATDDTLVHLLLPSEQNPSTHVLGLFRE